jgi:hypothetical protein
MHQGSQWSGFSANFNNRFKMCVPHFKEGFTRLAEAGMEGSFVHAEVSDRCVPLELNYLAYSHFWYHPQDNLEQFTAAQLAPHLGGEAAAARFVELLARAEAELLTEEEKAEIHETAEGWRQRSSIFWDSPDGATQDELRAGYRTWRRWRHLRHQADYPSHKVFQYDS